MSFAEQGLNKIEQSEKQILSPISSNDMTSTCTFFPKQHELYYNFINLHHCFLSDKLTPLTIVIINK